MQSHSWIGEPAGDDAPAACCLCLVEGGISGGDELVDDGSWAGRQADAERDAQAAGDLAPWLLANRRHHALGPLLGKLEMGSGQDHRELVAAEPHSAVDLSDTCL